jgi:hypothetical protein
LTRTGVPIAGVTLVGVDPTRSMGGGGLRRGPRAGTSPARSAASLVLRGRSSDPSTDPDDERPAPSWARRGQLTEGDPESAEGTSGGPKGAHRAKAPTEQGESDAPATAERDTPSPGYRVQSARERAFRNGGDDAALGPNFDTWSTVELGSEDR